MADIQILARQGITQTITIPRRKKEEIKQKQSRLLSMAKILAKHSEKTANRANCT